MEKIIESLRNHTDQLISKIPVFVEGIIVLVVFVIIAHFVRNMLNKRLENKTEDKLRAKFIAKVIYYAVIIIGLMLAMKVAGYGDVAGGLLAGAGISAFVVGFALKDIGENFLAGFLLSFSRPFRVDDTVEVNGITGKVKALNLRNTHIKTFDGIDVFVPNANLIKNSLKNYTLDGFMRYDYTIGVDYNSNFSQARETLLNVVNSHPGVDKTVGSPSVSYESLSPSAYNIKVTFWKNVFDNTYSTYVVKTELIDQSLEALSKIGIAIPGDILEIKTSTEKIA